MKVCLLLLILVYLFIYLRYFKGYSSGKIGTTRPSSMLNMFGSGQVYVTVTGIQNLSDL